MPPYGESPSAAAMSGVENGSIGCGGGEILLFGVRVKVDPMRKSVSMNNLSEYEPINGDKNKTNIDNNSDFPKEARAGENDVVPCYASADDAVSVRQPTKGIRGRRRGVPWTEEEHKLFLLGLQKVGKGDWRGISRNYVKTRSPTQVASHAQKYFLRRNNLNRRRRRSSLFDITTDSVTAMLIEGVRNHQGSPVQPVPRQPLLPQPVTSKTDGFSPVPFPVSVGSVPASVQGGKPVEIQLLA